MGFWWPCCNLSVYRTVRRALFRNTAGHRHRNIDEKAHANKPPLFDKDAASGLHNRRSYSFETKEILFSESFQFDTLKGPTQEQQTNYLKSLMTTVRTQQCRAVLINYSLQDPNVKPIRRLVYSAHSKSYTHFGIVHQVKLPRLHYNFSTRGRGPLTSDAGFFKYSWTATETSSGPRLYNNRNVFAALPTRVHEIRMNSKVKQSIYVYFSFVICTYGRETWTLGKTENDKT